MQFKKSSDFFYYVLSKYNLTRQELCSILGVERQTIYNFLAGYSSPKTNLIHKLAKHLNAEKDVFESLCFDSDKKFYSVGKPTFPNVRDEILKNCFTQWIRIEIANHDGTHELEHFLAAYTYHIIKDTKRLDTQLNMEVFSKETCLECLKVLESNNDDRSNMFKFTGKWFALENYLVCFENAKKDSPPLKFFYKSNDAIKYQKSLEIMNNNKIDKSIAELLSKYNKLPKHQKESILKAIDEKLVYTAMKDNFTFEAIL